MAIEEVKKYFEEIGILDKLQEFQTSSATVELAAQALNTEPARIAKTITFKNNDSYLIVVMAGDARIDNKKFKTRFNLKAKMLNAEEVEMFTGHPVGGVCPFALKVNAPVYLDDSLNRFPAIYPACGSKNSGIEMTCEELYKYSNAKSWVNVNNLEVNN